MWGGEGRGGEERGVVVVGGVVIRYDDIFDSDRSVSLIVYVDKSMICSSILPSYPILSCPVLLFILIDPI